MHTKTPESVLYAGVAPGVDPGRVRVLRQNSAPAYHEVIASLAPAEALELARNIQLLAENMVVPFMADPAVMTVARTIWGEARSGGFAGMRHVACVIANRVKNPGWWGHDFQSVCMAPYQFSCWNADDPNREKMETVGIDDPWFVQAWQIAKDTVSGRLADQTHGADSYYAHSMAVAPTWAKTAKRVYSDGWHDFYITRPTPLPSPPAPTADDLNADELKEIEG
jgi:hypothetical protein